jgi:hypothetical protein
MNSAPIVSGLFVLQATPRVQRVIDRQLGSQLLVVVRVGLAEALSDGQQSARLRGQVVLARVGAADDAREVLLAACLHGDDRLGIGVIG